MNKRYIVTSLVFLAVTSLAGCQTMQNKNQQESELMQPPSVSSEQVQSQQEQSQQQVTRVDFRLAQTSPAEGLSEMKFPDGTIWYLPTPVLSRADLARVEPRRSAESNAYVRFTFNDEGAKKLAMVTQRYPGKILVLTLNNSLESLVPIHGPITNGILDVGVQNDEQALAMVKNISSANK